MAKRKSADPMKDAMQAALESVERIERESKETSEPQEDDQDVAVEISDDPDTALPSEEAESTPGEALDPTEGETLAAESAQEVATLKDQLLRLAADFENFRKRARREKDEVRQYGVEKVLVDVLPVLDNLERAVAAAGAENNAVVQGVRMVAKQFADVLANHGVQGFDSQGKSFDPEYHEAMGQAPGGDVAPGTILEEMLKGYMLHERLLRPARVIVAGAAAPESAPPGEDGSEEEA